MANLQINDGHSLITFYGVFTTIFMPTRDGIPWLGFIVYPTHRRLKRRNAVNFTRRLRRNISRYRQHNISFAELDASVGGWVNHVRYADTWGLRGHIFGQHPIPPPDIT